MTKDAGGSNHVYLAVPYEQKDEARALGARWDSDRRLWWIDRRNIPLFPGVYRWIVGNPALRAQAQAADSFLRRQSAALQKRPKRKAQPRAEKAPTAVRLASCACQCLPWEDCEHSLALAQPRQATCRVERSAGV
jgi:hypothetical protein